MPSLAFYVKCRPQQADVCDLAIKYRRVFIGYPAWKQASNYDRQHVSEWLLNISHPESEWSPLLSDAHDRRYRSQITANSWYAREVKGGDIVVMPRPARGLCYIAQIESSFELVENPVWAAEYLDYRRNGGLPWEPEGYHVGDVVQTWHTSEWRAFQFALVPRWITYRLLSRNTIGVIYDRLD